MTSGDADLRTFEHETRGVSTEVSWVSFPNVAEYIVINRGFRVMMVVFPRSDYRCIKLTNDPPSGLRANLKQAFASFSREEYGDLEPR